MSIETALFTRLKAQVTLVSNRIYAAAAPQDVAKPYIVYTKESSRREYTHDGYADMQQTRIQISCIGNTYRSVKVVTNQVIAAMESWPQANNVQAVFIEDETDMYVWDLKLYHCLIDAIIWNNA